MMQELGRDEELVLALLAHTARRRPTQWYVLGDVLRYFAVHTNKFTDLERAVAGLEAEGLIVTLSDDHEITKTSVRLTRLGYQYLSERYDSHYDFVIHQAGCEPPQFIPGEMPSPAVASASEGWTGRGIRKFDDPQFVVRVQGHLNELDREIEFSELGNLEKACAKAISRALIELVQSPNPEWWAIVELLRSPVFSASLALAGLVQLIIGVIV